jgi:hypothetical protein
MAVMDRSIAWRAALLMGACVGVLAVVLAAALDRAFFEDWGWLAGPGAWALCALVCARAFRLPLVMTLVGAALSGLPSLVAVAAGVHWAGAPLGLVVFGLWCGWLAGRHDRASGRALSSPHTAEA